MVRKSLNALKGVKAKTVFNERKCNPHKHHSNYETKKQIDICLNCTKPVKECKGNCYEQ